MEAVIEKVVHGGYGLARVRGVVCLVPYSAPGDVLDVECSLDEKVAFGWITRIIEPSPRRRDPRCPVFGLCGGCDFDHIDYGFELEVKTRILREDLARIAKVGAPPLDAVVSAGEYGYRNHAQFKVDAAGRVGFFAKKSRDVVPLPPRGCLLLQGEITGFMKRLAVSGCFPRGGFRVRANAKGELFKKGFPGVPDDPFCYQYPGRLRLRLKVDDFFQVNRFLVGPWVERIESYLEPEPGDDVADLFCGSGIIALHLCGKVRSVTGVEMSGSAVESARYNARWNGAGNVSFVRGDSLRGLVSVARAGRANKLVVDPPRSGLSAELVEAIATLSPARVVYASCDTATFARDLAAFSRSGYALEKLTLVDMFPRTGHCEVVSALARKAPGRQGTDRA
jgi:23S rRNA (uracil1939-C5)-methyltransferase